MIRVGRFGHRLTTILLNIKQSVLHTALRGKWYMYMDVRLRNKDELVIVKSRSAANETIKLMYRGK